MADHDDLPRHRLEPADHPTGTSLQERFYPGLTCFGCGHANDKGLKLRSYEGVGGTIVATFDPWPEHDNGSGFLNGGIIATLLDCHGGAAVLSEAHRRDWTPDSGLMAYVTAGIDVKFLRPSPLHEPFDLVAELRSADDHQMVVESQLVWQGKPRATATALWKRFHPR